MPVRMTGMISGLDTESLIQGLMDAEKLKNKKVEDKQTLLTWKQEKWKELNAKIYKLYTQDISKMRLQGSYQTKSSYSSNESFVTATAGNNAPVGSHTISVNTLASSQYVTSGKFDTPVTTSTKLTGLGMTSTAGTSAVIHIQNGDVVRDLVVDDTTTINDFINTAKDAGLNASFDATQQRIFISSKSSGIANAFTINTMEISSEGATALASVKTLVDYSKSSSTEKTAITEAIDALEGKNQDTINTLWDTVKTAETKPIDTDSTKQTIIDSLFTLKNFALEKAVADTRSAAVTDTKNTVKADLITQFGTEDAAIIDDLKTTLNQKITAGTLIVPEGMTQEEYVNQKANETFSSYTAAQKTTAFNSIVDKKYSNATYQAQATAYYNNNIATNKTTALDNLKLSLDDYLANYTLTETDGTNLTKIGLANITGEAVNSPTYTVIAASDANITLDGAVLTSTSNLINANGLTITAKELTAGQVNLNVANNSQATYDMVKNFITSYNEVLQEMNDLYYADSASGYDPLSDDEKESMTDGQIEKWETKIKDSILRRDSSLGSLLSSMKNSMMNTVTVDGHKYSLANFGIKTATDYSEKGLLHIYGNADDSTYSGEEDKLKKAIEEDPDTVMQVISGVTKSLYNTMQDKMDSIPNIRSAYTFYNDKEMAKQQTDYTKQIATLEEKLTTMEDKYYKQFAAMESAMSKLQSQTNALSSMMGTTS